MVSDIDLFVSVSVVAFPTRVSVATGILPVANGGTGVTTSTGTTSVVLSDSPTIVTPTIASFTNATHNHQTSGGGGLLLSTSALSDTANIAYLNTANDFLGNNLSNIGLLNQKIDNTTAIHELEANHTTPADAQVVGQINFIDDNSIGGREIYGQIRTLIQDPTSTTEDGEMFLSAMKGGTLTDYISINEADGNTVIVKKALELTNVTLPGVTVMYIGSEADDMVFHVSTGDNFKMRIAGATQYLFDASAFNLNGNNIINTPQILDVNSNELLKFTTTASAVNELTLVNAATANAVQLQATGGDTNVDVRFVPKGTGTFYGNRETWAWPLSDETTVLTTTSTCMIVPFRHLSKMEL